jgi:hypothetical protein
VCGLGPDADKTAMELIAREYRNLAAAR